MSIGEETQDFSSAQAPSHAEEEVEKVAASESEIETPSERPKVETAPDKSASQQDAAGTMDGGATAWLVVLGAWCCSFTSPGWVNSVGSFQQYYEVGPLRNYSTDTIAWIPSMQLFFAFALGPLVGILFDRYGPRPLIAGGTFFHVFGLMMASLAKDGQYYQFMLSQGVCSAIGVAFLYSPALMCVTTWFSKKRGLAMGIMVTGGSVGGVIFPIMVTRMIDEVGYPWAMRTCAFLILFLQIIAILTVRPRTKPVPKKMPPGRYAAPFTEPGFATLLLAIFVLTYGMFIPLQYLSVQGYQEAHMSESMSQYLVAIFNGASLFGRLLTGYGADKLGRWNVFILSAVVSAIGELALWIPATSPSIAIGFSVYFGFSSGAFISLVGALPASVSPLPEIGYRLGVVFLAIALPSLTLGPIGGAILQGSSGWLGVKLFGGILAIAGALITLASRLIYTEKKLFVVY